MRTFGFDPKSPLSRRLAIGLIILMVPFLALADFLLFRQAFFYFDFEVQYIPFHYFAHSAMTGGQTMLWNPYIMLGYPIHGESQLGAFYPVNLILHWLPNQTYAVSLSLYLHLVIAMVATWLLARSYRLGALASLHAAVCFGLSGYMFAQFTNYNIALVSVYLPLKLLFITWYFERGRAVYLLYFALISAAELLVSHVNMSFITSITAGLYFVMLAVMKSRSMALARDLGLYTACSVLAIVLAAVQIVPTFEFFTLTERSGGLSYDAVTSYSHGFATYLTAFFPMMYGALSLDYSGGPFSETYFFVGSFGILLALCGGLIFLRRRDSRYFAAMGILGFMGLLFSLGVNDPIDTYRLLVHVPGFNLFRCPARWSLLLTLALAIFSGYGLQALIGYMQARKPAVPVLIIVVMALIAPLAVYGLAWNEEGVDGLMLWGKITQPLIADLSWLRSPIDRGLYALFTRISPLMYFLSVICVLVTVTLAAYRLPARYCAAIIAALGLLDMLLVIKPLNPATSPDLYRGTPSHIAYVQQSVGVQRAVSTEDVPTPISLNGGAPMVYGVQSLKGWASLNLNNYLLLTDHLSKPEIRDYVGVKYEIAPFDEGEGYGVNERPGAFPRAFLLEHYWIEHDTEAAFNAFIDMDEAARRTSAVLDAESARLLGLEPNPPPADFEDAAEIRPANIIAYDHGRIELEAETRSPAFLLLTDMHYPGWRARVNGKEVPVIPLNGVFRGVFIDEPGPFSLEFEYRPLPFRIGAWLSSAALLLSALIILMLRRRHPSSERPASIGALLNRMLSRSGSP